MAADPTDQAEQLLWALFVAAAVNSPGCLAVASRREHDVIGAHSVTLHC